MDLLDDLSDDELRSSFDDELFLLFNYKEKNGICKYMCLTKRQLILLKRLNKCVCVYNNIFNTMYIK